MYFKIQSENRDNADEDDNTAPQRLNVDKIFNFVMDSTTFINAEV